MSLIPKPTPGAVGSRPSLSSIDRRVGTHAAFKEAMMRGLRSRHRPGLKGFATQSDEDWSIALIDAWAAVCDTLSFYSERINQESYLRTATEVMSVEALAQLVGYTLSPATAAECYLSFQADTQQPTHSVFEVAEGLGVKSIPDDGELPQVFETLEALRAKPTWNDLPVLTHWPQSVTEDDAGFFVNPAAQSLRIGARIVLLDESGTPRQGRRNENLMCRIARTDPVADGLSYVSLDADEQTPDLPVSGGLLRPEASEGSDLKLGSTEEFFAALSDTRWTRESVLDGADYLGLSTTDLGTSLRRQPHTNAGLLPHVLTQACRLFGHNAVVTRADPPITPAPGTVSERVLDTEFEAEDDEIALYLDRAYEGITAGMFVLIRGASEEGQTEAWCHVISAETISVEGYGLSGEVTRLVVPLQWTALDGMVEIKGLFVRKTALFTLPEPIGLPDLPLSDTVSGGAILLDKPDIDLAVGQSLFVTAERADLAGVVQSERIALTEVEVNGTTGRISFEPSLSHAYARGTVRLCANVARASHGEATEEILGSGDATKHFQSFTLKDGPLTYLSADVPSGHAATLEVFVDGVLWHEVPAFDAAASGARVYVLSTLSDGKSRITFGNGTMGATLPTGENNVVARYRKGAGQAGRLRAGQLSLMVSKPRSLSAVVNPLAATGGSDGEGLEAARENAPLHMLTLDRIVSLQDYADFARAFSGVSKAHAAWNWMDGVQSVFLTVTGETPDPLPTDTGVLANLVNAIAVSSPSGTKVTVQNASYAYFTLAAKLRIDPDYTAQAGGSDPVFAQVRATLRAAYAFDVRRIGEGVRAADVLSVIQSVPGVLAVDLDLLHRADSAPLRNTVLRARMPRSGATVQGVARPLGAEMLLLSDEPISLGVF